LADKDCENGVCKVTVSEEQYAELEKAILRILIPSPEQRRPEAWGRACSRVPLEKIMVVVKQFVIDRLVEFVEKK
jgi:hypothetical protein